VAPEESADEVAHYRCGGAILQGPGLGEAAPEEGAEEVAAAAAGGVENDVLDVLEVEVHDLVKYWSNTGQILVGSDPGFDQRLTSI
jgi:hypothetical protein